MSVDEQPSLRERQAQQVGTDLRQAFIRLVVDKGPNGFALRDVAAEAGVSERTLYRYYPNRDALIAGVRENENAEMEVRLGEVRRALTDISDPEAMANVYEIFEEYRDFVRAAAILRQAGITDSDSGARTARLRSAVEGLANVPPAAHDQLTGLVRALSSSDGFMRMTGPDVGLSAREAGYAAQWAIQVLLDAAASADGPLRPKGHSS